MKRRKPNARKVRARSSPSAPRVAVVGGGIAGLTAALRLAERGYKVTVYDERPVLGGNVAAHEHDGTYHDIYSHMFSNFYYNFWHIIEHDLGYKREEKFEPRNSVKVLDKGAWPNTAELSDVGSMASGWANILSGVEAPADMFLWVYSMIDLMAQPPERSKLLDRYTVNGFVQSRPYATERTAELHDIILMTIWSIHSYATCASAYKKFIEFSFPNPSPLTWVLKGNLAEHLVDPISAKLRSLGATLEPGVSVRKVVVSNGKATRIEVVDATFDEQTHAVGYKEKSRRSVPVDGLILAVHPAGLGLLTEEGAVGERIVDALPELTEVRRLKGVPVAVLDLYFNKRLTGIPKEHVLLRGSAGDLTFLDLAQAWDNLKEEDTTALTVAASDYYALPSSDPGDDAHRMVCELHKYMPIFKHGKGWGDPNSDIDWKRTHFQTNTGATLFVNEEGSEEWRPNHSYAGVDNLFFAGDCCVNPVSMATVEAAVTSGLGAASALQQRVGVGAPVQIIPHEKFPLEFILALKAALAPAAYAAKLASTASDGIPHLSEGRFPAAIAHGMTSMMELTWAPYSVALDWWRTLASQLADFKDA